MTLKRKQPKQEHTHKYLKTKIGVNRDYVVFKCVQPHCSHYIHESLITGRVSECWRCGKPFQMFGELARRTRPHCSRCTVRKTNVQDASKAIRSLSTGNILERLQTLSSAADKSRPALPSMFTLRNEHEGVEIGDHDGDSEGEGGED